MAEIYDADDPDLDAFRDSGGKLLMWQSWADSAALPLGTIAYYDSVEERVGNREATQDFFRLFMVPGAAHCGFGSGPRHSFLRHRPAYGVRALGRTGRGSREPSHDKDRFNGRNALDAPGLPLSTASRLQGDRQRQGRFKFSVCGSVSRSRWLRVEHSRSRWRSPAAARSRIPSGNNPCGKLSAEGFPTHAQSATTPPDSGLSLMPGPYCSARNFALNRKDRAE